MEPSERVQLDNWITHEDPVQAEWDERLDRIADNLGVLENRDILIIEAMIAGEFNCAHCLSGAGLCEDSVYCLLAGNTIHKNPKETFCDRWQRKGEG